MKKRDFKKLIITGIASGALLASQAGTADNHHDNKDEKGTYLAAGGCGANSCAGKPNVNGTNDANGTNANGNNGAKKSAKPVAPGTEETPIDTPVPAKDGDVSDNSTTGKGGCHAKNSCNGKGRTNNAPRGSSCAANSGSK